MSDDREDMPYQVGGNTGTNHNIIGNPWPDRASRLIAVLVKEISRTTVWADIEKTVDAITHIRIQEGCHTNEWNIINNADGLTGERGKT